MDGDGDLDPLDIAFLAGGPPYACDDAADVDDDGFSGTALDIDLLQQHVLHGGTPPPPPFPECGVDVTIDLLSCGFHDCQLCDCGVWGDINADGNINPLDVSFLVRFVYQAQDARVPPPNCYADVGDVNCSGGAPNPLDVTILVNKVYRSLDSICPNPCTIHGFD